MVAGDPNMGYYEYVSRNYLNNRSSLLALSLACGSGGSELTWAQLGKFKRIDGYDLSNERIADAKQKAREIHLESILNFKVANLYDLRIIENYYDVVLAESAFHHLTPLEVIMERTSRFMKPNGYLIIKDFVGPTRFQWTDRQLDITNGLLDVFPLKYKRRWRTGTTKLGVFRPSILSMLLMDPSEAVESSRIMPLLRKVFDIVEVKEYGGTILNLLFSDIAHHFISVDEDAKKILRVCLDVEDLLLKLKEVPSDFAFVVCKKRAPK
jgi:SAM-dependent methyltransferase